MIKDILTKIAAIVVFPIVSLKKLYTNHRHLARVLAGVYTIFVGIVGLGVFAFGAIWVWRYAKQLFVFLGSFFGTFLKSIGMSTEMIMFIIVLIIVFYGFGALVFMDDEDVKPQHKQSAQKSNKEKKKR